MNNLKISVALAGVTATALMNMTGEVDATSQKMQVVNTSSLKILNIQDQRKVVETISSGSTVTVIKPMENQKGWYYVETMSGKRGVCSGLYLKSVSQTVNTDSTTQGLYETKVNLNLRAGDGVNYKVLRTIPAGASVSKISQLNGWTKVNYNGTVGYCSSQYLTLKSTSNNTSQSTSTKTYYSTTNNLNVRFGASTSSNVYKKLSKGDSVNVVKVRNDGWSEVLINGKTYYVSSQYLSNTKPSGTNSSTSQSTSTKVYYSTENNLNVRFGASTSSNVYKKLSKGDSVNVVKVRNDGWSEVLIGEKVYYISSKYLSSIKPSGTNNTDYRYSYTATTTTLKTSVNSLKNMEVAFKYMDGTIVKPGETFSYLKVIKDRTPENGYVKSTVILNGKPSVDYGGGICQGSTTLHNAVMKSGLKVVERRNHSLPSKYVAKGLDAMVSGSLDYKFKNTSNHNIRIRCYVSGKQAVVKLESTGDLTNGYTYEPEVEVSSDGLRATTNVWKKKNGEKLEIHKTFYSKYRSAS